MTEAENTAAETGGPAFPTAMPLAGMTLRDYFAARVLQGVFSDRGVLAAMATGTRGQEAEVASAAYGMADAMLSERAATRGHA